MAHSVYKLTFTKENGEVVDAGEIVVPHGEDGEPGAQGEPGADGTRIFTVERNSQINARGDEYYVYNFNNEIGDLRVNDYVLVTIEDSEYFELGTLLRVTRLESEEVFVEAVCNLRGAPGAMGAMGAMGATGATGESGKSAYQIYVDNGGTLTEIQWLASLAQGAPEYAASTAECTDTGKMYVLPDGYIYAYLETTVETDPVPGYTDLVPLSTESDGTTPYNGGLGYKSGYRVSSSGAEKESSFNYCTGFIPVVPGDVIRIKNHSASAAGYETLVVFKSDHTVSINVATTQLNPDNDGIVTYTIASGNAAYIRVTSTPNSEPRMVITVNEEIKMSEGGTTSGHQWASTGLAFIPADYEDRIVELENEVFGSVQTDLLEKIRNWDAPIYDANIPVFQLSTEKAEIPYSTRGNVSQLYSKYDALMAKHPQYITKTDLGLCSDGVTHVYRYDFREPDGLHESGKGWSETKTKAILVSGIHYEWAGIYNLYYALEEIADNPALYHLRRNTHFIVVPIVNPYGCSNWESVFSGEHNANGVEIHRNFEVDFAYPGASNYVEQGVRHHGGTAPLSEIETQYIDNIMKTNTDAALFLTCHNFGTPADQRFIWASTATKYMCNMAYRLVDKVSFAWRNNADYGSALQVGSAEYWTGDLPDGENRFGYASISGTNGTETKQATKYGIQSTNVETGQTFTVHGTKANPESVMSSFTMSRGAEVYVNFLLTALGCYDPKDKEKYFN